MTNWEYTKYDRSSQIGASGDLVRHAWVADPVGEQVTTSDQFPTADEYPFSERYDELQSRTGDINIEEDCEWYVWRIQLGHHGDQYKQITLQTSARPWDENTPEYLRQELATKVRKTLDAIGDEESIRVLQIRVEGIQRKDAS